MMQRLKHKTGNRPGVYKLVIGERYYIGSTKRLSRRKGAHWQMLTRQRKHSNQKVMAAFEEHGSFEFVVLEFCEADQLLEIEQKYLDLAKGDPNCLNIAWSADGNWGVKRSEEHKQAVRKAHLGKQYRLGSVNSPETRKKISDKVKKAWAEGRIPHAARNQPHGEKHCHAKLTREDVFNIYRLREQGLLHKDIAEVYNITRANVSLILKGTNWIREYEEFYGKKKNH